ncbi:11136_t:CDS:2 [Entrophospora sp. SA101]|nr:11136_t:CDS:2 [Entrophospora sp. SA101]
MCRLVDNLKIHLRLWSVLTTPVRPTIADLIKYGKQEMKRVYDDPAANVTYEDQSSSSTHWMHPEAFHTSRALNSIIPSSLNKTYILWQYDLEITEMFEELVKMFSYDEKDNNIILNQ